MKTEKEFEMKEVFINFYGNEDKSENIMVAFDDVLIAEQSPEVNGLQKHDGPVKSLYIVEKKDESKIITS